MSQMKDKSNIMKFVKYFSVCLLVIVIACNSAENKVNENAKSDIKSNDVSLNYNIVKVYDIDPAAFVQGLIYEDGKLLISTGLKEHSSLRVFDLATEIEQKNLKIEDYFCEGIAKINNKIYQLTWQDGKCIVYDAKSFDKITEYDYEGEGWGLATDGNQLIMSDGTNKIKIIDPANFKVNKVIKVTDDKGFPVYNLNELEFVNGMLWANIWTSDDIIAIDLQSGVVQKRINLSELRTKLSPENKYAEVLNGIAYNPQKNIYYLTGKFWGKVFEVEIK